eukprot:10845112-Alexandrium_andersonii.AAC.1
MVLFLVFCCCAVLFLFLCQCLRLRAHGHSGPEPCDRGRVCGKRERSHTTVVLVFKRCRLGRSSPRNSLNCASS